jgi:hypothetical protein
MGVGGCQIVNDSFRGEKLFKGFVDILSSIVGTETEDRAVRALTLLETAEVHDSLWGIGLQLEEPNPGVTGVVVDEGNVV